VNAPCRIVALHGFLGRPSDWDGLGAWFPEASVVALDLWTVIDRPGVEDWASLPGALDGALREMLAGDDAPPAFLVAYSFGARLALSSALLASTESPFRGCCFVSCHPGLPDRDAPARDLRRAADDAWAERILALPEDELWRAWDAQPVFVGAVPPPRRDGLPASRDLLARALRRFTLAGQPDCRSRLRSWRGPLLWLTGARDDKFSAIAGELSAAGVSATFVNCDNAGHRVPWDNPSAFSRAVRTWIARVMETDR
jgi:2-succinyl-6-hydroxy-2,4-cyclohexadiene-1-carboxylate synthase